MFCLILGGPVAALCGYGAADIQIFRREYRRVNSSRPGFESHQTTGPPGPRETEVQEKTQGAEISGNQ